VALFVERKCCEESNWLRQWRKQAVSMKIRTVELFADAKARANRWEMRLPLYSVELLGYIVTRHWQSIHS
jgi:hypothetical protein